MSALKYLFLFLVSSLILIGCSKKSSNPLSPVDPGKEGNDGGNNVNGQAELIINGGGFNNLTMSFSQGVSYFIPSENVTYAEFWSMNNSDTLIISIVFPGSEEGTFDWEIYNPSAFLITGASNGSKVFVGTNYGETYISAYGTVNQNIVGKVYGILKNSDDETEDLTIDGNFNLKRLPDVND